MMRLPPRYSQWLAVALMAMATLTTLLVLIFIILFILEKGLPTLSWEFLLSLPRDMGKAGGILPVILATIILPLLAIAIALPLGVGTAIYLTEYTRENRMTRLIRFGNDCLAGIPSIIFGLFGFIFFVTLLEMGWSLLSGGLTLALMILPTIIRTSEEAIKSVPPAYREVSYSLGATQWRTIRRVVLPNALPGILTGVMLGIGRAIGETAALIFTAGSSLRLPHSLFDSARTMSVHFYILAREGLSTENAYRTATVLILSVLLVNASAYYLMHRYLKKKS
jgi:phosphate transport system permease protein